MTNWKVRYKDFQGYVEANNPGSAAKKFFQQLIKTEQIKRQPPPTNDGGWEDTTIEPVGGWK